MKLETHLHPRLPRQIRHTIYKSNISCQDKKIVGKPVEVADHNIIHEGFGGKADANPFGTAAYGTAYMTK